MANTIRVGMALTNADESRMMAAWLTAAEMEVETLVEACAVASNVAGRGVGCVVADGALIASGYLTSLRRHDGRVPVVAIVDPGTQHDPAFKRAGVSVVTRPCDAATLALTVSLAYGESRQARRRPRQRAPRVPSRVSGVPATIVDISRDGVRLELARAYAARLGPQFRLQVPMVALDVVMQRAWVANASGDSVLCGAQLVNPDPSQQLAWERIMELTSTTMSLSGMSERARPGENAKDLHLLGRVSLLWSSATRVTDWASQLTRGR